MLWRFLLFSSQPVQEGWITCLDISTSTGLKLGKINPALAEETQIFLCFTISTGMDSRALLLCDPAGGAAGWTSCLVLSRSEGIDAQQAGSS